MVVGTLGASCAKLSGRLSIVLLRDGVLGGLPERLSPGAPHSFCFFASPVAP